VVDGEPRAWVVQCHLANVWKELGAPELGALFIVLVQQILSDIFREWLVFVGITYVVLIVFLPKGLFPLFAKTSPQKGST
jgi:ABC-type branched-subunit amino acid transport system permease subunit